MDHEQTNEGGKIVEGASRCVKIDPILGTGHTRIMIESKENGFVIENCNDHKEYIALDVGEVLEAVTSCIVDDKTR